MAGKGIEIDIAANTRDFQRGTKDVEAALEEVADALDDVSRDADKTGKKIGGELSDGAKDAEQSVEKLEKSFKDVADASKRETGRAGDAMKRNTKEATTAAQRDLAELKDEAVQNASETFSSFDGSMTSFADGIQGTFGGIVSNMGPVGAAAGAAGAIGIGLIMKAFDDANISEEEFRQRVKDLADTLIETGGEGADAWEAAADRMQELVAPTDDGALSLKKLREQAAKAGVDFADLARAYGHAGGDLEKYADEVDNLTRSSVNQAGALNDATSAAYQQTDALVDLSGDVRDLVKEQEAAEQAQRDWIESGGAAIAARAEQMDTLQSELDEAVGSWSDYTDAEGAATDPAAYLAAMQARMDATSNFNSNVQKLAEDFGLTSEEVQAILDQGVDFAPMLQSIVDSGMGEQYAEQVRSMLGGGQAIIDGTPTTATITTKVEADAAADELAKVAEDRPTIIGATADTRTAAAALGALAAQSRVATIETRADTTAAQGALDRFIAERRVVDVVIRTVDREGREIP